MNVMIYAYKLEAKKHSAVRVHQYKSNPIKFKLK